MGQRNRAGITDLRFHRKTLNPDKGDILKSLAKKLKVVSAIQNRIAGDAQLEHAGVEVQEAPLGEQVPDDLLREREQRPGALCAEDLRAAVGAVDVERRLDVERTQERRDGGLVGVEPLELRP